MQGLFLEAAGAEEPQIYGTLNIVADAEAGECVAQPMQWTLSVRIEYYRGRAGLKFSVLPVEVERKYTTLVI